MKIMISYQVDTVEEAKEVMAAVENRGKLTTFRVQDEPVKVYDQFSELGKAGIAGDEPLDQLHEEKLVVKTTEVRPNVSPGVPLITKIGGPAKALILDELGTGTIQPHAKYAEHLKLLWSRGEIRFDGKEFYL